MRVGTRSVVFGVHALWWHGFTVLLAWRRLYKQWPSWPILLAILLHDIGYWGLPNIDGPEGKRHPFRGARWTARLVILLEHGYWLQCPLFDGCEGSFIYYFTAAHSRDVAAMLGADVSKLYAADKASILYDPKWWYLCRAKLSGEIREFKSHAIRSGRLIATATDGQWYDYYKHTVLNRKGIKELL